jgi:hypothetical protein
LTTAIRGADGCLDGTEVCQVSYGISTLGDEADYELTITREEAESIAKEIRIGQYNSAMLASGDRFYTMWFNTVDEGALRSAQIETSFLEPLPEKPTPIAAGESLTFTVVIRTWATYGGPAHIDLTADLFARDSGLLANIEPAVLELPERSEAKAVVTITATQDARDGVYSFSVGGVINGYGLIPSGPCEYGSCEIKVGESGWHISTFGSDTQMWQSGPGKVPDWLRLDLETDKMTYKPGEPIEIRSYLSNDGEESLVLDRGSMRLMTAVHGPTEKEGSHVYGIDAYDFDSTDPLVIEPHATVLLVRSFTWDQKTMSWGVPPQQVPAGNYNIDVSLSGYENAVLKDSSIVTIS